MCTLQRLTCTDNQPQVVYVQAPQTLTAATQPQSQIVYVQQPQQETAQSVASNTQPNVQIVRAEGQRNEGGGIKESELIPSAPPQSEIEYVQTSAPPQPVHSQQVQMTQPVTAAKAPTKIVYVEQKTQSTAYHDVETEKAALIERPPTASKYDNQPPAPSTECCCVVM